MPESMYSTKKLVTFYFHTIKSTVLCTLLLSQLLLIPYQIHNVDATSTISSSPSMATAVSSSSASSSSESISKFGGLMVRQPESTVAPLYDEVLFECELNLTPDRVEWRFRSQNAIKNLQYFNDQNNDFIYLKKNVSNKFLLLSHFYFD